MMRRLSLGCVARCATTSIMMVLSGSAIAATVTYTGGDATDATDWFAPDNWGGYVPVAGDDVVVPSGFSPVLSNSTPQYASVSVGGTIVFTNWTTCLSATTVTIPSGGILTCAGPFTDSEMSNRVWVACTDFTVASGGKVNVSEKGFGSAAQGRASYGPGSGTGNGAGGAYGGFGGFAYAGNGTLYGEFAMPTDPGSSGHVHGSRSGNKIIGNGGGAVRIDATGTVAINGAITANGKSAVDGYGGGSGGSVLVIANKIVSNGGSVTANGGNGVGNGWSAHAGGGGRIAFRYNADAQSQEDLISLTVSAGAGKKYASSTIQPWNTSTENNDADIGTVYFSDAKPLKFLGTSLTGQIYLGSGASYSCDSITMTSGWVRFAQEGFALYVAGNVSLSGTNTRLEMGGNTYYRAGNCKHLRSGATPWTFSVGGDVAVASGAWLDLYAAATNGTAAAGGTLAVAGDLTISANSKLNLSCDAQNGGAPLVTADNITVAEDAIVSADYRGFAAAFGPGRGSASDKKSANANAEIGAGHGGAGNKADATYGKVYDDPVRPTLAGSGGALAYDTTSPLSGGGVVHLVAAKDMTVNGSISASACNPVATTSSSTSGSGESARFATGAGGTVLLEAKTFTMGASAKVSANGSNIDDGGALFKNGGAGGGGRIAVYTGAPYVEGETKASRLVVTETQPSGLLGSFSVTGGVWKDKNGYGRKYVAAGDKIGVVIEGGVEVDHGDETAESATWYVCPLSEATVRGGDGTIRFVTVKPKPGFLLIVK